MPEGAVYVGRPTKWGNPFILPDDRSLGEIVRMYREWLAQSNPLKNIHGMRRIAVLSDLRTLRGKDLACWCPLDRPCHADVLLEIANKN